MSRYDQPLNGETDQAKPYEPELQGFPMPKTEEFSEGEGAKRAKLIEEAMAKVEAELNNERKEKYCEDIVAEIRRIGRVLAEKGFGSRSEDKHVAVTSYAGGETRDSRGNFVQYETAVVARVLREGSPTGALNQWATEDQIFKGSECKITDPYNEEQYKNAQQEGINISVVTGPAVEVYSDRPLTEERKDYYRDFYPVGTVLVTSAGRCNDEAKVLRVGGRLGDSTNPKAYELVLAAMQDIEKGLPASKETQ